MPVDPDQAVWFINQLRHVRGQWAGQRFNLRPWQEKDVVRPLLAINKKTGRRKVREALIGMPRKNGKTQLVAGLGVTLLVADGEAGGEVIAGAAKRDQAALILDTAKRMVQTSVVGGVPLSQFLKVQRNAIYYPELDAVFRTVSADAPREHGLNPHAVLVDELHAQPNRDLWDALTTAQGARRDPLAIAITTAGPTPRGLCWQLYQYGKEIESGHRKDDAFMFRWWEPPAGKDWRDESVWHFSNPALGDFLSLEELRRMASTKPEYVFRRLHLNQWTTALERWLPAEKWDLGKLPPDIPEGSTVVLGLDAALRRDTFGVGIVRLEQPEDGGRPVAHVMGKAFTPARPGQYIDQIDVETYVLGLTARFDVEAVVYDPAYMQLIAQRLADHGVPMEPFPQRGERIIRAAELLQQFTLEGRIRHGDDQTINEQLGNAGIRMTDRGVQIMKGRSGGPVDVIVSIAMALEAAVGDTGGGDDFAFVVGQ